MGAADRVGAGLGQPEVEDLALLDQRSDSTRGLLDRSSRVDAVLVVQVDLVGAETAQ